MSVIGNLGGVTGRPLVETLGKREGYAHGRISNGDQTRAHACPGGEPSNGSQINNVCPALANGIIKKLIVDDIQSGGGRLDMYAKVNGLDILVGNNPGAGGLVTLDFDRAFVAGDLIGWASQRNSSNGTFEYTVFCEIEWTEALDNIQHWYGGLYRGLQGAAGSFYQVGEVSHSAIFPLSSRTEFQNRFQRGGRILDYGFYGQVPVGVDNVADYEIEINGSPVVTNVLSQHAARVFDNFTGVNVSFSEGDLVDIHAVAPNNGDGIEGLPTMRIQFD